MDLTPYISSLREDLSNAAAAGDEQTQRVAAVLAAALEPAARLAVMNALSDLAAEVTARLDDHVVDVRLDGRDVRVVVTGGEPRAQRADAPEAEQPPPPPPAEGDISRMTLRLFEEIKRKAEQAAAAQGMSLNSFISQAVQSAVHKPSPQQRDAWREATRQWKEQWKSGGDSLHGWVQG